jgi:hypothetical protein
MRLCGRTVKISQTIAAVVIPAILSIPSFVPLKRPMLSTTQIALLAENFVSDGMKMVQPYPPWRIAPVVLSRPSSRFFSRSPSPSLHVVLTFAAGRRWRAELTRQGARGGK